SRARIPASVRGVELGSPRRPGRFAGSRPVPCGKVVRKPHERCLAGVQAPPAGVGRAAARAVPDRGLPGPVGRPDAACAAGRVGVRGHERERPAVALGLAACTALPRETVRADLHCVTRWSKLGTSWRGVSVDTLLAEVETAADFALAYSYGGYTTNLPLEDLRDGKAWIAYEYE